MKELSTNNIWISHFNNLLNKHKNRLILEDEKWVDFEDEIFQVVKRLNAAISYAKEKGNKRNENLSSEYSFISNFTRDHNCISGISSRFVDVNVLSNLNKRLLIDLQRLTRCLELYLVHHIERTVISKRLDDIPTTFEFDGVLSFNYTDIFTKFYKVKGFPETEENIVYIHGKAQIDEEKTNMVLGIDEYFDDNKKDSDIECIEYKKYFQRIHKKTGNQYKQWIENMIEPPPYYADHNVFILGHSLGFSDREVLKEFFEGKHTTITIFYHNNNAFKNYIANLVRIIGQEEVIHRVYGHNPSILFVEQDTSLPIVHLLNNPPKERTIMTAVSFD